MKKGNNFFCKHNYIILTGTQQEVEKQTETENGLYQQMKFRVGCCIQCTKCGKQKNIWQKN